MKKILTLLLSVSLFYVQSLHAAHIVGGELTYTCIGGNQYEVTLILYRDCAGFGADFDNPASLGIYNSAGVLIENVSLPYPTVIVLPLDFDDPCLEAPPGICVSQGITSAIITLPDADDTYTIVYQRCCRNASIINLDLPDDTGSTWWHEILPDTTVVCNSSPYFNFYPPIVICQNNPFVFDHSASDPDGDSLAYKFITPYAGASTLAPMPSPPPPPEYAGVVFLPAYTFDYPIDALPVFAIDPLTGIITGTPTGLGRYVVGIGVEEWRDGVLLGIHYRDFQFNVNECTPTIVAATTDYVLECEDFTVNFTNTSIGTTNFLWDFGDGSTSIDFAPAHTYADTGTYTVILIAEPGAGCSDTTIATIAIYNVLTADFSFDAGCSGTPVEFTDLSNSTLAGDIIDWNWNFGDGTLSSTSSPTYEYGGGGAFDVTLTVETDKGCISTITQIVNVDPGPNADFSVDNICLNELATVNNLTTFPAGALNAGFTWDFGDGFISNDDEPTHTYATAGSYTITLVAAAANGCTDTISYTIIVGALPNADAGVDDYVEYLADYILNGSGDGTFSWNPAGLCSDPTSPNPTVNLETDQTFILTVTSPDGCVETDTVTIYIIQRTIIGVPNAFSPNGDGINDELFILNHYVDRLDEYSIYNRWGQLIFTTTDISKGWDGTYKDKDQDVGSFIYVVRGLGLDGLTFDVKGNVTVIR